MKEIENASTSTIIPVVVKNLSTEAVLATRTTSPVKKLANNAAFHVSEYDFLPARFILS